MIKFKKGWTLAELCITMIALAVLVGLSIQTIKPRRIMVGPFAYAGMKNIREATFYILTKCEKDPNSVYGCAGDGNLPNTADAISQIEAAHPGEAVQEVLCFETANIFSIMGDINCAYNNGSGDGTKLPTGDGKGANAGKANFQATNMVSYYFLERPWMKIKRAMPVEGTDESMNISEETLYKEIFIDTNGTQPPNKVGEDQFPLRIYITGEVIPSYCDSTDIYKEQSDSGESLGKMCPAGVTGNWLSSFYPFNYNLFRSFIPDPDDAEHRATTRILYGVSYKEAACKGGKDIMIPREHFCKNMTEDDTTKTGGPNDIDYSTLPACKNDPDGMGTNLEEAFCVTRLGRPSNPGLFKLPIF